MTLCKHTIYFIGGRKEHLCDTCVVDDQVCDKNGAYRLWGGPGWKVSGCAKYEKRCILRAIGGPAKYSDYEPIPGRDDESRDI